MRSGLLTACYRSACLRIWLASFNFIQLPFHFICTLSASLLVAWRMKNLREKKTGDKMLLENVDPACWMIAIEFHIFVLCNETVLFPNMWWMSGCSLFVWARECFLPDFSLLNLQSPFYQQWCRRSRLSRKEVEWKWDWPIRCADKLSSNRLLLSSHALALRSLGRGYGIYSQEQLLRSFW